MKTIRTTAVSGLVIAALVGGLAVPTFASAQTAPGGAYGGGYRYDACQREQTTRGTGGALVGAGLGALAGGNIAARGNRTEGAVLGGILGAVIGSQVGRSAAACQPGTYSEAPPAGSAYGYSQGGYQGYEGGYEGYQESAYDDDQDDDDDGYYAAPVADTTGAGDCTLAESPIYLPNGKVEKRYVRVCKDARGEYHVVD